MSVAEVPDSCGVAPDVSELTPLVIPGNRATATKMPTNTAIKASVIVLPMFAIGFSSSLRHGYIRSHAHFSSEKFLNHIEYGCGLMTDEPPQRDKIAQLLAIDTAQDENVTNLTKELTSAINIETKTDLSEKQMVPMSKAIWYAKRYDIQPLDLYTRKIMLKIRVSKDRGGRKDILEGLTGVFRFSLEKQRNETVKV